MEIGTTTITKPFLRWAGGKTWLVKHLGELLSQVNFKNYHEPFLGGGSIFFSLPTHKKAFLSDLNDDLIKVYKTIRDDPDGIIKVLKSFQNNEEFYYKIRGENPTDPVEHAARFIYLNQTSFNGIYRVNLKGVYNVPFGFRSKNFFEPEILNEASRKLKDTELFSCDFNETRKNVRKGDLVFLDPPYTVSHNNNGFIKYNQKLFSLKDQGRLSKYIDSIRKKGAYYVLTNAAHQKIGEIFEKGDKRIELKRASLIGGTNATRGSVSEYIFTNIEI